MNKLIIIPIVIGIIVAISVAAVSIENKPSVTETKPVYDSGFTYYDIEKIQTTLKEYDVNVSKPAVITDHTIDQYCMYFDKGLPRTVEYCTTTVVTFEGKSIGNINLGGDVNSPILAIANIETKTLDSNKDEVYAIFETMIEQLICDCWEDQQSEGYESITEWLDAVEKFHLDSDGRNVKSKIENLKESEILLEITPKENSVLRTLIILK